MLSSASSNDIRFDHEIVLEMLDHHHAPALLKLVKSSRPELKQWLPWVDRMQTVSDFERYISRCKLQHGDRTEFSYMIKVNEQPAGRIGIHYIDSQNKSGAIGYWIGKNFAGRGIITKACTALIDYCFNQLALNRVELKCARGNLKSAAVAERLGFIKEGVLRQAEWINGEPHDLNLYSMLKGDWEK